MKTFLPYPDIPPFPPNQNLTSKLNPPPLPQLPPLPKLTTPPPLQNLRPLPKQAGKTTQGVSSNLIPFSHQEPAQQKFLYPIPPAFEIPTQPNALQPPPPFINPPAIPIISSLEPVPHVPFPPFSFPLQPPAFPDHPPSKKTFP